MTEAIFGLVGVVLGAGIAGWLDSLGRRHSEAAEARIAARLMLHEIQNLVFTTPEVDEEEAYRQPYDFSGPLDTWREQRATLARTLTNEEWADVAAVMELLPGIHGSQPTQIGRTTRHGREVGFDEEEMERGIIDLLVRRADEAVLALQRAAFGEDEAKAVRRERADLIDETRATEPPSEEA